MFGDQRPMWAQLAPLLFLRSSKGSLVFFVGFVWNLELQGGWGWTNLENPCCSKMKSTVQKECALRSWLQQYSWLFPHRWLRKWLIIRWCRWFLPRRVFLFWVSWRPLPIFVRVLPHWGLIWSSRSFRRGLPLCQHLGLCSWGSKVCLHGWRAYQHGRDTNHIGFWFYVWGYLGCHHLRTVVIVNLFRWFPFWFWGGWQSWVRYLRLHRRRVDRQWDGQFAYTLWFKYMKI